MFKMFRHHFYRFLLGWLPGKTGKGLWLRLHGHRCPLCQAKLAGPDEVRAFLWTSEDMEKEEGFCPSLDLESRLKREARLLIQEPPFPDRSWRTRRLVVSSATIAIFLVLLLSGYFFLRQAAIHPFGRKENMDEAVRGLRDRERFSLTSLKVGGEPASPIIYQPFGSDYIFVWAQPQKHKNQDQEIKEDSP